MAFKDRLKATRMEHGITITQLAAQLNKGESAVRMWEIGRSNPDLDTLIKLAKYFDCSVDYLLDCSDIRNIEKGVSIPIYIPDEALTSSDEIIDLCRDNFRVITTYATLPEGEKDIFSNMIKNFNIILDMCKTIGRIDNLMGQVSGIIELHEAATNLSVISARLTEQAFNKYCELKGGKPKRGMRFSSQPPRKEATDNAT